MGSPPRKETATNAEERASPSSTPGAEDGDEGTYHVDMPTWDMSGLSWFDDDF
jgi:hypothetical protein